MVNNKLTKRLPRSKNALDTKSTLRVENQPQKASSDDWMWFTTKYPSHPALKNDTIYALPTELIDEICKSAPGFLTAQSEEFERALAERTGTGFFLQHPIWSDPIADWSPSPFKNNPEVLARRERESQEMHAVRIDMMKKNEKLNDLQIERILKTERSLRQEIEARRIGYAGWLATNADFRIEVAGLREKWGDKIQAVRDFPRPDRIMFGEKIFTETRFIPAVLGDFMPFYQRWCLERLATWELPIPLCPESIDGTLYNLEQMRDAGTVLFVPFYLFRDKTFDLHALGSHDISQSPRKHLDGWLKREYQKWGHERFGAMLRVFIFYELVLKQRYLDRLHGYTHKLDIALQKYLSHSKRELAETVKRIRMELNRLLRPKST